jgi:hypothetical protein
MHFNPFRSYSGNLLYFFFAPPSTFSVSYASFYFSFLSYLWYFLIAGVDGQVITEKGTLDKVIKNNTVDTNVVHRIIEH